MFGLGKIVQYNIVFYYYGKDITDLLVEYSICAKVKH